MNAPVILAGGGLWIEFYWTGDRWGHRVGVDPDRVAILESIEGTPNEDWPPSPALQELHIEPRPDGKQIALLVGMAGTSHWSMSVELDAAKGEAVFDAACRLKRTPARLSSTYEAVAKQLRMLNSLATESNTSTRSELISSRAVISPKDLIGQFPVTSCWRYTIKKEVHIDTHHLHLC